MVETAGSVVIQIGGNIAPFEAALAKANQLATTFDAQITAKLSGAGLSEGLAKISAGIDATNALLEKLTTSGASAGATMTRLAATTAPVTAALQQVTAASAATNAELGKIGTTATSAGFSAGTISAKEFAAALEATGGNLSKITPAMLGIAEAESAVTAATLEATAAFRGLTEAQIQAFAAQQEGRNFNLALNESFGLINSNTKSARESASVFRDMAVAEGEAGVAARGAAASVEALGVASSHATGLGAGVTREFSVLGAEVLRGNFSRIPGSLLVMNERLVSTGAGVLTLANGMKALGSLAEVVLNPFVLGFLAITVGSDLAVKAFRSIGSSVEDVNTVLKNHKNLIDEIAGAYPTAAAAAKAYEDQVKLIPQSVAGADVAKQVKTETDTLASAMRDFRVEFNLLFQGDTGQADFAKLGQAGRAAFENISQGIKSGQMDAIQLQKVVAEIRVDPTLPKAAHEYADALQDAANKAADLERSLQGTNAAAAVFKGSTVGRGDEGANMLANMVSAGNAAADALKKANDNLDTTGMTAYARAVANLNQQFDDAIVKAHASGAALATFNQARDISLQAESLKALGGVSFDTSIAGADKLGIALTTAGQAANQAKISIGGIAAPVVNMTQLLGAAKLDQLLGVESATKQLEEYKLSLTHVSELMATTKNLSASFFGDAFKGTQADISGAYTAIDNVFKLFDTGRASVMGVHDRIEEVRASLIALHGDNSAVNEFINDIVNGEAKTRQLNSDVQTLGHSIASLPNKTVTITVVTRQVGSGTQSIYDVPNSSGGTSGVGVTRYGGTAGQQSGPSVSAYSVPTYDAGQGGMVNTGSGAGDTGVTVTRFGGTRAAGGPVGANTPYWVGEHGPELVVPSSAGSVIPNAQSTALANAQSGFTGRDPTKDNERYWTVLMNIEANTRKTAQLLDDIHTISSSSGLGGSGASSGSVSSGGGADTQRAAYLRAYATAMSNAQGVSGIIGYGSQGLSATPAQIAWNIVYGGMSSVGNPTGSSSTGQQGYSALHGGDAYAQQLAGMSPSSPGYAQAYAQALAAQNKTAGFATGGMIGGDTQKVEFFKNPNEKVIIARPDQFADVRPGSSSAGSSGGGNDNRQITVQQYITVPGGGTVSKDSLAALGRQVEQSTRAALRSVNGR